VSAIVGQCIQVARLGAEKLLPKHITYGDTKGMLWLQGSYIGRCGSVVWQYR